MSTSLPALGIIFAQLTTTAVITGFTDRQSLYRYAGLSLTTTFAYSQFDNVKQIQWPVGRGFLGAASIFLVILYIDTALLSRWTFVAKGPTSPAGGLVPVNAYYTDSGPDRHATGSTAYVFSAFVDRARFGYSISLQSRFPNTSWRIKNIPSFSRSDPGYIPDRVNFISCELFRCLVFTLLLRLTSEFGNPEENVVLFASNRIPFLSRIDEVSVEEYYTRVLAVIAYWTVQYMILQVIYSFLAISAVAVHATPVSSWPPIFGSVSEAWSVRQFWGSFYHQFVRQGCSSNAHFMVYACLHLKKGSLVARYAFLTCTFAISGVFHALSDISQGIPGAESGAVRFFCSQAVGIMFEDAVQAWFKQSKKKLHFNIPARVQQFLGMSWLIVWLTWTTPIWVYPSMQRDTGAPIIPF